MLAGPAAATALFKHTIRRAKLIAAPTAFRKINRVGQRAENNPNSPNSPFSKTSVAGRAAKIRRVLGVLTATWLNTSRPDPSASVSQATIRSELNAPQQGERGGFGRGGCESPGHWQNVPAAFGQYLGISTCNENPHATTKYSDFTGICSARRMRHCRASPTTLLTAEAVRIFSGSQPQHHAILHRVP